MDFVIGIGCFIAGFLVKVAIDYHRATKEIDEWNRRRGYF